MLGTVFGRGLWLRRWTMRCLVPVPGRCVGRQIGAGITAGLLIADGGTPLLGTRQCVAHVQHEKALRTETVQKALSGRA